MEYNTVDLFNDTIEDDFVVYDNGSFHFDFPNSGALEVVDVHDMNELGQFLVSRANGDLCLWDDAICYTIEPQILLGPR